jgi:renalase
MPSLSGGRLGAYIQMGLESTKNRDLVDAAVLGGGIAGCAAVERLAASGLSVILIEKSRGMGGRASVRRFEGGRSGHLGLPYFVTSDPNFRVALESACGAGALIKTPWTRYDTVGGGFAVSEVYLGARGSNDFCKHVLDLAQTSVGQTGSVAPVLLSGHRVVGLRWTCAGSSVPDVGCWEISTVASDNTVSVQFSRFVLITFPAPQAAALLVGIDRDLWAARVASASDFVPAWVVLVEANWSVFEGLDEIVFSGGLQPYPVSRICRLAPGASVWQVCADPEWTAQNLESSPGDVAGILMRNVSDASGVPGDAAQVLAVHLWRYAYPHLNGRMPDFWKPRAGMTLSRQTEGLSPFLMATGAPLCLAGDWLGSAGAEGAWLSGVKAAEAIILRSRQSDLLR